MSVKRSRSATRVLRVLEGIAHHQPIGVSELARLLDDDKSAVQRSIMTLADTGWIGPSLGKPKRWQLTAHILTVAHTAHNGNNLVERAKSTLEMLRSETGETILLAVPDVRSFVTIEVLESRKMLRTAPNIGMVIPARGSATSRAILAYMQPEEQFELLGEAPDEVLLEHFATTLKQGYAVSEGGVIEGSTNISAPVFELGGRPIAAITVSGPSDRLNAQEQHRIGKMLIQAARGISRGLPAATLPTAGVSS